MKLPNSCEHCAPFGGTWREGPNGGMTRCDCARGLALVAAANPVNREPVLPAAAAMVYAEMLAGIPFYPSEAGARAAIADEIACMCETPEQATWLVRRMRRMYTRWPGVAELRLMFCTKHLPLDGIQASCESEAYPDGIPSETANLPQLPAAPQKQLAAPPRATAAELTEAKSIRDTIAALAVAKDLNRTVRPPRVPEIPVNNHKPITQADIDRAKQERLDKLAREEMAVSNA